jgi:hypothetical protein
MLSSGQSASYSKLNLRFELQQCLNRFTFTWIIRIPLPLCSQATVKYIQKDQKTLLNIMYPTGRPRPRYTINKSMY